MEIAHRAVRPCFDAHLGGPAQPLRAGPRCESLMTMELAVTAALFTGVVVYAVLGGADFGSGFFDLTAGGARRGAEVRTPGGSQHRSGLGGEPRLVDLCPRDVVDRVP